MMGWYSTPPNVSSNRLNISLNTLQSPPPYSPLLVVSVDSEERLEVVTASLAAVLGRESVDDLGVDNNVKEVQATEEEAKIDNIYFVLSFPELH